MDGTIKNRLFEGGLATIFSTAALVGCKLTEYGLQSGSVALTGTGGVLCFSGAVLTGYMLAAANLNTIMGSIAGPILTLGAFEYAGNPIIKMDPMVTPETKEVKLTSKEYAEIQKPFQPHPTLRYSLS